MPSNYHRTMELQETKNRSTMRFRGGEIVGDLTLIEVAGTKHFRRGVAVVWRCRCVCGRVVERDRQTLIRSKHPSCGECRTIGTAPPGKWRHPLYKSWRHMIARCTEPKNKSFPDYGGRGISVCSRWIDGEDGLTGLECFALDMGERPTGLTLERQDVNCGYEPSNCVWASRTVQGRNKRSVRLIEFRGESLPITVWAERTGIPYFTLYARLKKWPVERALTEPVAK